MAMTMTIRTDGTNLKNRIGRARGHMSGEPRGAAVDEGTSSRCRKSTEARAAGISESRRAIEHAHPIPHEREEHR